MLHEATLAREAVASPAKVRLQQRPVVVCVLLVAALMAVQVLWFSRDIRVPSTDEAGHILNGMQYTKLFHHFHPWRLNWLREFLSVNPFYPPAVYVYDGFLRLILGNARWVDTTCFLSYFAALLASTYGITWLVSRSVRAAALGTIIVFCYPQIQHLSHVYLLDLPLAAMVSVAMFALMWWKERPTTVRTAAACAAIALCCFTKQLGACYLLPPCLFLLATQPWRQKRDLLAMAAATSALLLPWLLVNGSWIKSYAVENAQHMQGAQLPVWVVFGDYFVGLAHSMSFALCVAFLAASAFLPRETHKKLFLLFLSAFGGLALSSLLTCTFALDRYAAPFLIFTAVATACGAQHIRRRNKMAGAAFAVGVVFVGLVQVSAFSFGVGSTNGMYLREFRGARITNSLPQNDSGWQRAWALKTVTDYDKNAPVWLNILPSDGIFNPHSFELLAADIGSAVKPTTSRRWTIMGDTVEFSPETALWYHWYLVKTGYQGNRFKDEQSKANYEKLTQFIAESGKFKLVDSKVLPDTSTMYLYRQK